MSFMLWCMCVMLLSVHILSGWAKVDCINPTPPPSPFFYPQLPFTSLLPQIFRQIPWSSKWVGRVTSVQPATRGDTCKQSRHQTDPGRTQHWSFRRQEAVVITVHTSRRGAHQPECSRTGWGGWDCGSLFLWSGIENLYQWICSSKPDWGTEGWHSSCPRSIRDILMRNIHFFLCLRFVFITAICFSVSLTNGKEKFLHCKMWFIFKANCAMLLNCSTYKSIDDAIIHSSHYVLNITSVLLNHYKWNWPCCFQTWNTTQQVTVCWTNRKGDDSGN